MLEDHDTSKDHRERPVNREGSSRQSSSSRDKFHRDDSSRTLVKREIDVSSRSQDRAVHSKDRSVHSKDRSVHSKDRSIHSKDRSIHSRDRDRRGKTDGTVWDRLGDQTGNYIVL